MIPQQHFTQRKQRSKEAKCSVLLCFFALYSFALFAWNKSAKHTQSKICLNPQHPRHPRSISQKINILQIRNIRVIGVPIQKSFQIRPIRVIRVPSIRRARTTINQQPSTISPPHAKNPPLPPLPPHPDHRPTKMDPGSPWCMERNNRHPRSLQPPYRFRCKAKHSSHHQNGNCSLSL